MKALSFAVLAPNPHNRQPWIAELVEDDGLRIYRDPNLNLPETDPFDRQLTIGMGCFLELLRIAAAEDGYVLETTLFPEGESGPVAEIVFRDGGVADPLFRHVLDRHTDRNAYEDRPVAPQAVAALTEYAGLVTDKAQVEALTEIAWESLRIEMVTHRVFEESIELTRIGKNEINANPDGISLGGPLMDTLALFGMVSREGMADTSSTAFQQALEMMRNAIESTPAYAVITTAGNDRVAQIGAGRDWLRLHLTATGFGLAMQPVSQSLQEYAEVSEQYARIHEMLAAEGETVQMLGRVGYGSGAKASPRWPVEAKILKS